MPVIYLSQSRVEREEEGEGEREGGKGKWGRSGMEDEAKKRKPKLNKAKTELSQILPVGREMGKERRGGRKGRRRRRENRGAKGERGGWI